MKGKQHDTFAVARPSLDVYNNLESRSSCAQDWQHAFQHGTTAVFLHPARLLQLLMSPDGGMF